MTDTGWSHSFAFNGMVKDDGQRKVYYETLKEESGRLAMLVENVLSYARVEDGRAKTQVQPIGVGELVARTRPVLERRCQDAGGVFGPSPLSRAASRRCWSRQPSR